MLGDRRLRRSTVALVLRAARRLAVRLIADMVAQLDLHRPLHQPLRQLRQQPAGPGDLLLGARTGEQLVDQLIADPLRGHPQSLPHTAAATRTADGLIDQLWRELPPRPARGRVTRSGRAAAGAPLRSTPTAGNTNSCDSA